MNGGEAVDIQVAEFKLNIPKHLAKIRDAKYWKFAASEWHRLYRRYVPFKEGILYNQVRISGGKEEGVIEHTAPYAHYMYEGMVYGPNYPIVQAGVVVGYYSPKAPKHPTGRRISYRGTGTRHWDEAAQPTQGPLLIRSMQAYVDSGRVNFDDA